MTRSRTRQMLVLGLAVVAALAGEARAQKKSDAVVKVKAEAGKLADDGAQTVTVTLTVEPGWHLYANPVGFEDLESVQTTVTVKGESPLKSVKIDYPKGKTVKDQALGAEYNEYEGTVAIKAHVQRAPGDAGPLTVAVKFQSCSAKQCLLPATVQIKVP